MKLLLNIRTTGDYNCDSFRIRNAISTPIANTVLTKNQLIAAVSSWRNPAAQNMWWRMGLYRHKQ